MQTNAYWCNPLRTYARGCHWGVTGVSDRGVTGVSDRGVSWRWLSESYFPITLPHAQTASRTSENPIILRSPGNSTNVGQVGMLLPNPYWCA